MIKVTEVTQQKTERDEKILEIIRTDAGFATYTSSGGREDRETCRFDDGSGLDHTPGERPPSPEGISSR